MTGVVETPRSADIVYQDFARECYIWIWCDHINNYYTIHKSVDANTIINKYYIVSRREMRQELLCIEEAVNVTAMKPQWHRIKGEQIVLNVLNLYKADEEDEEANEEDE